MSRDSGLNHRLRLLISPCRSGSTAVLNCFAQHAQVVAYYQFVKTGLRDGKGEDHGLFYCDGQSEDSLQFIVDKETLGPHTEAESSLRIFPEEAAIAVTRPVFLFRDPVYTWNSWVQQGWINYGLFELAYVNSFRLYLDAVSVDRPSVLSIIFEELTAEPYETISAVCRHWEVPYHDWMLHWHKRFAPNVTIRGGPDLLESLEEGSFRTVQETNTIERIDRTLVIPKPDIERIQNSQLSQIYASLKNATGELTAAPAWWTGDATNATSSHVQ